ncbi:MAG: hypothetical protein ACYDEN_09650 [Acidimicrobiales bacterium]
MPGLTVLFGITYLALHLLATGAALLWLPAPAPPRTPGCASHCSPRAS